MRQSQVHHQQRTDAYPISCGGQGELRNQMPLLRERTDKRGHRDNLMKEDWKPGTMIYPLPAVLVSCGSTPEEYNILTVAWTGTICTNPPMCYISVRPERHSYDIIKRNMEFVINLTTKDMARATDWCGVRSGKNYNKFEEMKLTPGKSTVVSAPLIEESPLCIECRVKEIVALGSHDMFIADVVNVRADTSHLNTETGKLELAESNLLVYVHGGYYNWVKRSVNLAGLLRRKIVING